MNETISIFLLNLIKKYSLIVPNGNVIKVASTVMIESLKTLEAISTKRFYFVH